MVRVLIKASSGYSVDQKRLCQKVQEAIKNHGLKGEIEVSVAIVNEALIKRLNKQYRNCDQATDVLSFSLDDLKGPDGVRRLGEVMVAYSIAKKQAKENGISVEEEIDNLVIHGVNHLLGIHHDE